MNSGDPGGPAFTSLDRATLERKFALISDYWHPRIVGEVNGQYIKIAKLKGDFVWHSHADGDELFYVHRGTLVMLMRDSGGGVEERTIGEGGMIVVPRGMEHKSVAPEEVQVVLIEPTTMVNTGGVRNERTLDRLEWI